MHDTYPALRKGSAQLRADPGVRFYENDEIEQEKQGIKPAKDDDIEGTLIVELPAERPGQKRKVSWKKWFALILVVLSFGFPIVAAVFATVLLNPPMLVNVVEIVSGSPKGGQGDRSGATKSNPWLTADGSAEPISYTIREARLTWYNPMILSQVTFFDNWPTITLVIPSELSTSRLVVACDRLQPARNCPALPLLQCLKDADFLASCSTVLKAGKVNTGDSLIPFPAILRQRHFLSFWHGVLADFEKAVQSLEPLQPVEDAKPLWWASEIRARSPDSFRILYETASTQNETSASDKGPLLTATVGPWRARQRTQDYRSSESIDMAGPKRFTLYVQEQSGSWQRAAANSMQQLLPTQTENEANITASSMAPMEEEVYEGEGESFAGGKKDDAKTVRVKRLPDAMRNGTAHWKRGRRYAEDDDDSVASTNFEPRDLPRRMTVNVPTLQLGSDLLSNARGISIYHHHSVARIEGPRLMEYLMRLCVHECLYKSGTNLFKTLAEDASDITSINNNQDLRQSTESCRSRMSQKLQLLLDAHYRGQLSAQTLLEGTFTLALIGVLQFFSKIEYHLELTPGDPSKPPLPSQVSDYALTFKKKQKPSAQIGDHYVKSRANTEVFLSVALNLTSSYLTRLIKQNICVTDRKVVEFNADVRNVRPCPSCYGPLIYGDFRVPISLPCP